MPTFENPKQLGYITAVLSVLLLGSEGVFVRNLSTSSYTITFARLGLGLLFLVVFLALKKDLHSLKIPSFSFPMLSSGVCTSLAILCYTNAIKSTTLANAAFLLYLGPLIAVGLAALLLKERFHWFNLGLLVLAFVGFLCLLEGKFSFQRAESVGYLWGLGSALFYGLYIVLNRKIPMAVPALTRAFYQFFFGAVIMVPFIDPLVLNSSAHDWAWLIGIGFFQGFVALTLIIIAVKHLKAIEYGTVSYLEPLVAAGLGLVLYGEHLSPLQLAGAAIILSGGLLQILSTVKTAAPEG